MGSLQKVFNTLMRHFIDETIRPPLPPTITLAEVDQYPAGNLPLVDQMTITDDPQTVDELLKRDPHLELLVAQHVDATIDSIRGVGGRTVLHVFLSEGRLRPGQVAARLHADPRKVRPTIEMLARAGVLTVDSEDGPDSPHMTSYSLSRTALGFVLSRRN